MTFRNIATEAVAATARLATRSGIAELAAVAAHAQTSLSGDRARPATECPLAGALGMIPDDAHADTAPLVEVVRHDFADLGWFRNAAVPSDFVSESAAAELIGPDGGIPSDDLRFGLFIISPHTHYVRHWHAAEEHYMVLAGTARWDLDDGWTDHRPGDVIQITSMTPHAIETTGNAVLTLYSWTGDVSFETYAH